MIKLAKMKRRICSRIGKPLYTFMVLLVSLLAQQENNQHSPTRQVNGNLLQASNNSLPALSERANGGAVNSRYLSASSTASLAAATVAAAATNGATSSQSGQSNSVANSQQQQEANRNFLLHQQQQQQQQQHQQQQQQAAAAQVNGVQVNQGTNLIGNQAQQQSINVAQQSPTLNGQTIVQNQAGQQQQQQQQQQQVSNQVGGPQFNSVQAQQVGSQQQVTPIMSTTYTFNPLTGQYVPSDLSTGSLQLGSGASLSTVNNNNNNQNTNYQQQFGVNSQQPYLGGGNQNNPFSNLNSYPYQQRFNQQQQQQPLVGLGQQFSLLPPSSSSQFGNLFGGNQQFNQNPYNTAALGLQGSPFNLNQIVNQQRQASQQFSRRQGNYQSGSSSRLNPTNAYGQQQQQPIEDDSGFFQQQQQSSSSSIVPSSEALSSLGGGGGGGFNGNFGLDSAYGNLPPPSGSGYLIGGLNHHNHQYNQNNQHHSSSYNDLHSSQPSSVSSVILPTPTTSFGTAFGGVSSSQSAAALLDYKNDQCVAADNRHGTCYQASECIKKGGTPMGKCGGQSSEYSGSSYVCCLFDISCGQFAAERFVYFRNPNYPNTYDQSRMCRAKIGKLDKGVCQFRLDLIRFDVAKPTNGNCSNDMFVVSGQNENYIIPKICGLNDGQHYYVGVDESGVITLHMMMMGFYRRSFEILITQIPCRSDYAAPAHCLQYYMGTHGTIKSFNYDDDFGQQISSPSQTTTYDLLQQAAANQQQQIAEQLAGGGSGFGGGTIPTAPYGLQFNSNNNNGGGGGGGQLQQRQQQLLNSALATNHQGGQQQQQLVSRFGSIYVAQNSIGGGGNNNLDNNNNNNQFGGYPNDLDYTMCIRKESGFCSITYQLSRGDQGSLQPFAVGQSTFFGAGNSNLFNDTQGSTAAGGWQPVSTECRDDYLLIGGVRLCSTNAFPQSYQANELQFAQNGTLLSSQFLQGGGGSAAALQQQLQNQHALLLQQLSRLQQQQQAAGNVTYANNNNNNINNGNNNSVQQQQQQLGTNNNLEQQQAAILQQAMMIQQQLNSLASNNNNNFLQQQQNNRYQQQQAHLDGQYSDLQGAIITDTTSGPFILRFVSNTARNARGFHIDYRQNPCK